jgi:hypothetical protein
MKSSLMRPALALALALALTACGGGKATFPIAGTVTGLQYSGLTLASNGQTAKVEPKTVGTASDVAFTFAKSIEYGEEYDITITAQPAHQSCNRISGYQDTAGRLATIHATIQCGLLSPQLGGTITGLHADGLVLTNGSASSIALNGVSTTATDGTVTVTYPTAFTMPASVTYGTTYGVTVLSQPKGQTCSVANGTGIMGDVAVTNVAVTCVNNPTTTP